MSDYYGGAHTTVRLIDLATRMPRVLADTPVIVRGAMTGLLARPNSKASIGTVFQDRAARYGDRVFLKFGDQQLTYRDANATANRYAAVLAARGVGPGDVVGIMLRNSPSTVLAMLATVKCGAIAGMLNYHQRGEVLAHSLGLLDAKVLIAESDLVSAVAECGASRGRVAGDVLTVEDVERFATTAPATNPASASAVQAKDTAFYIFTSGTTGFPKASVMTHHRWLRALAVFGGMGLRLKGSDTLYSCLPLYHNNALTVAVSSVINSGATLALGKSFSASRFWDEVIANRATAFVYIGEICRYLLNQPAKPTDRAHQVRVICGNGLRPEIWDEFTTRFGVARVCEFYAASEGNSAFINIFNVPRTAGVSPMPLAFVEYDLDTGDPLRDASGRVRRVPDGEPGLLLSRVNRLQPFDGYTDPVASEKKLVRNAFRDGDCWFNTGDVMSPQACRLRRSAGRHLPLEGRECRHHSGRSGTGLRPDRRGVHGLRRPDSAHRRARRNGRDHTARWRRIRRPGAGPNGLRSLARLCTSALCSGSGVAGAHHDVQESQGGVAQPGLWRRHRGSAVRTGRPGRRICAVLRRIP